MVAEGLGINHLHIKFYPAYGLKDKFQVVNAEFIMFIPGNYKGFTCTAMGPEAKDEELKGIQSKFLELLRT